MKKVLSYILISLIISANLFAPFSVGWGKNSLEVKSNKAEALFDNKISLTETPSKTDKTITVNFSVAFSQKPAPLTNEGVRITKTDPVSGVADVRTFVVADLTEGGQDTDGFYIYTNPKPVLFDNLTPNTPYIITAEARQINTITTKYIVGLIYNFSNLWDPKNDTPVDKVIFIIKIDGTVTTNPEGITKLQTETTQTGTGQNSNGTSLECSILPPNIPGCIAQAFYYVLFVPTSYLFALAGTMFDYTFSYSVQDSSYRSVFVVQGWGLIRDFCNLFFIFIMLYIAIGTILNLSSVKTKETIINVVIIGLFINFSLFATQLIIDASNITARVFYNSNAIKITEKGANGVAKATPGLEIGADGTIPLSAALVNKVNPQNLIMSADKISSIKNNSTSGVAGVETKSLGVMQFILVIIMASAVNIVGFTVFITVAFLFIARVIGLWLAMILAPLAFFTYILPEMSGIKMIGWKNWWPETLKMAFLAPVFIFFMYLILKFLQADLITDIVGKSMSGDGLGYFVAILVPFAFIMIFMIKAKKIAVDMSGEFGETVTKVGGAVSGMVLGGAVGVGAMAMRGTVGKVGEKLDKAGWVNNMAGSKNVAFSFLGNKFKDVGQKVASKSFDVRNTEMGAAAGKGMGSDIGKGKEGGYTKDRKDFVERKQKRAKEIEVNEDEELTQVVNKAEIDLQVLLNQTTKEFEAIDKTLVALRQKKNDATSIADKQAITTLINAEVLKKDNIKNGLTGVVIVGGPNDGKTIKEMETNVIPDAKNAKLTKSRERTTGFANATGFWGTNRGKEAQHKIIMETKLDSGTKT